MGNRRVCSVSYTDSSGVRHSVQVAAESLYEAAALAIQQFREHPWTEGMEPGSVTRLAVSIHAPETTHEVTLHQIEKWIAGVAKSPHETLLRSRVKEILSTSRRSPV